LGLPILKREILLSHDLICACSSPAGYGARQIIRITGDKALDCVSSFLHFKMPNLNISKGLVSASFLLDDFRSVESNQTILKKNKKQQTKIKKKIR